SVDRMIPDFGKGLPNAIPVVGNWPGSTGLGDKVGVYTDGTWYLDMNGNGQWNPGTDTMVADFGKGLTGAQPVVGDWNNTGSIKVGVFWNGTWFLDNNGNYGWNGTGTGLDVMYPDFGKALPNALPVVVRW
ncbi:MAG TPA: hypothetical protein VK445_06060, partial [Dissulfurispiraceae bacterium]|nr:hypothetical protein [Dissulfurispiraceae bacterium]